MVKSHASGRKSDDSGKSVGELRSEPSLRA
jgi:hypothetical protein